MNCLMVNNNVTFNISSYIRIVRQDVSNHFSTDTRIVTELPATSASTLYYIVEHVKRSQEYDDTDPWNFDSHKHLGCTDVQHDISSLINATLGNWTNTARLHNKGGVCYSIVRWKSFLEEIENFNDLSISSERLN